MTDLYVVEGHPFTMPHGSIVTQVTLHGSRRQQGRQLDLLKSLAWVYGCVIKTPSGVTFLVYIRAEADSEENRVVNDWLFTIQSRGARLSETAADRILEPSGGPYPHSDERLMHAVQAGAISADGFAVRLHFTSERHGDTSLFHAVRASVEEAMRTVQHIERPCTACLRPYLNIVSSDSEFAMADIVPFVLLPF